MKTLRYGESATGIRRKLLGLYARFAGAVNRVCELAGIHIASASHWRMEQDRRALAFSRPARDRILTLARLLTPQQAVGKRKIRVGSAEDGGYICLDDFEGLREAFSLGIGMRDDWGTAVAEKGVAVHQFDHTVDAPAPTNDRCHFHKSKIVPIKTTAATEDLGSLLTRYAAPTSSPILKMDIEGDEWAVLAAATDRTLRRFSQIIIEFHYMSSAAKDGRYGQALSALQRLDKNFAVVHVHGNNTVPWVPIGNVPFPETLEVTYANRERYELKKSDEVFPTPLDAPNDRARCDMYLGRFDFPHQEKPQ